MIFLLEKIFWGSGIQSVAVLYHCEQCVNLCQQVISHPPRRNKRDIWTGKKEKNGLYITYITLYSLCIQQGGNMIYDKDSGACRATHTHTWIYFSSNVAANIKAEAKNIAANLWTWFGRQPKIVLHKTTNSVCKKLLHCKKVMVN